ncbi:MAG: hypothetical protein M1834_000048 [Cirrosporium novae-zelandiae]|nr:MAG: hypothetical protein M1834_000048 [Cirrosporium novae-zelandiae]
METFDTMTMQYLASPLSLNAAGNDYLNAMQPMDMQDRQSNFDTETFVGSEDFGYGPPQNFQPQMRRFPSNFEDPFADALAQFPPQQQQQEETTADSTIERDNKLLGFSFPTFNFNLLDYSLRRATISLSAQLHGMFFLAESPWTAAGEPSGPPSELTCYRRNLFQITGQVVLPRTLRFILTDQGDQIPILGQELHISATESVEGNPVKIISVPWKTPASNQQATPEDKSEKEPPSVPLDLMSNQDMDSEFATFPFAWKRLQFRIATANNGRRKELQQHFVVKLQVMATLSTGGKISICEVQSGPIIVRGRSPRNFQSRKDLPLNGGSVSARKSHAPTRQNTGDSGPRPVPKSEKSPEVSQIVFQYEQNNNQTSPNADGWNKKPALPNTAMAAAPPPSSHGRKRSYAKSSPEMSRSEPHPPPSAPINLSLTEDETKTKVTQLSPSKMRSNTTSGANAVPQNRYKMPRLSSHNMSPSLSDGSVKYISSPDESADLLYEYFPLGLDDWMPPVDAVYRPHVVHHTKTIADPKEMAVRNRTKRYFSSEE